MKLLKQSTAVDIPLGPFVDSADGATPETSLTLSQADIRLKKNGGAWAQKNQTSSATHEENGNYEVNLNATDTDTLGILRVFVNEAGALPVWDDYLVVPANVYDALVLGTDKLQVHADEITNGLITAASIADGAIDAGAIADNAITAAKLAANCISDDQLHTNAVNEIRNAVTGGAYALSTDANGHVRVVDGTGAGELDTSSGKVSIVSADIASIQSGLATAANLATVAGYLDTEIAAILADTNEIQTDLADGGRLDLILDAILTDTGTTLQGELDAIQAVTDKLDTALEADGATGYQFTTLALENAPAGGGGSTDWTADERTAIRSILGIPGSGTTPADPTTGILDTIRDSVATRASQTSVDTIDDFLDTEVAAIKAKTDQLTFTTANRVDSTTQSGVSTLDAAGVRAAVGLASANLDTQLDALPTNAELATALAAADDAVLSAIAALNNLSAAQVNAEVVDALATDTYAEPTGAPAATATLAAKINYLYMALRNKVTVTSSAKTFCDDAGNAEWSKALSDDGTTYTEAEGA